MDCRNISHEIGEIAKNYDYRQPPDILIKLQDLIAYLLRLLRDFLSYLRLPQFGNSDTSAIGNLLQILVVAAGVVASVMVLLVVATRLRALQTQRALALGAITVGESPLDCRGWLSLAAELEGKGSHKEACRAVYMSILHLLDERSIMAFSAFKTNYEYFYALKRMPKVAESFRQLVDLVEYIWFGDKAATAEDYKRCREHASRVEEALPPIGVPPITLSKNAPEAARANQ